jgi:hypothetical protein
MGISNTFRRLSLPMLLAVALLIRLQSWHPFLVVDEDTILTMVWGLHLNPLPPGMPPPLPGYPPFFIYLNFLLSLLYREVLLFLGVFSSSGEFLASSSARLLTLKAGQILVAILGTLHVAVVWKIGREFFDQRVAWLAALLIAFHPHLVLNGHIFKSDVPMALLFSLLLLFSLRFLRTLRTEEFLAASFLAGLTAACKYNGAIEALLLPFLIWMSRKELARGRWRKLLFLSPFFGLLGFLAGAPNWAVHPAESFRAAYRYAVFHFQEFTFYDQVSSTYGRYVVDLWQTLGPLFLLLFVLGLIFTFLRRKKEEMTIVLSLLLYFLIQGRSVFYGSRIILPILGAVALIAAKGAFRDLYSFLKSHSWQRLFSIVIFAAALFFSLGNIRDSLSLFNLWKTSSTLEEAMAFRKDHIPPAFPFGREAFTPRKAGDRGYWDIFGIPDPRLFQGAKALPFLTTGILADHLLNNSPNKNLKENLRFRLQEYRVFHRISKPRFSPWDGDILFWYRPHPRLRAIHHGRESISLPRLFRPQGGTTLFYPLQPYEKDPGFFALEGVFFGKWILSSRLLGDISVTLFCPEGEIEAKLKVNGRETILRASSGTAESIFSAPGPLPFQKSPLYRIEAQLPEKHPPAFLLVQERSSVSASGTFLLASPLAVNSPAPFSTEMPPGWVREFYRRTGIDIPLLSMTQEVIIWDNPQRSLLPFASAWTVLSRGVYRWEMEAEALAEKVPESDPPPFEIDFFRNNRLETRTLAWEKIAQGRYTVLMENPEERIFLRVKSGDFRKQNILLRCLSIRPDYLQSLRQGMIQRISAQ